MRWLKWSQKQSCISHRASLSLSVPVFVRVVVSVVFLTVGVGANVAVIVPDEAAIFISSPTCAGTH